MPRRLLRIGRAEPLVRALPLSILGQRPNQGLSPSFDKTLKARHSRTSHQTAKPESGSISPFPRHCDGFVEERR